MKKLLTAIAVAGLIGTPAFAADMAVKAPPPAPAPVYSWTGFYVGGNVGYSWGKADTDFSADPIIIDVPQRPLVTLPGFAGSDSVKPHGIIGGGQIGYNWQYSPNWVVGVEADIQASGEKASNTFTNAFNVSPVPLTTVIGTAVTNYESKIEWFGTLRGRIGYVWDRWMLYATGGLAYGEVKIAGISTVSGTVLASTTSPFAVVTGFGHSQINAGWTVGGGIEGSLVNNWTWKAEYLYMDLGALNDPDLPIALLNASGGRVHTHTTFTDNIVRAGLNYQFH
jgi:outer membrane immunogenic protein